MILRQWEQVLGLKLPLKGQTRRPVREGERLLYERGDGLFYESWDRHPGDVPTIAIVYPVSLKGPDLRIKWQVGRTYAVQPGRGKKAVGRIRITKIRRERLQEISEEDCKAEGIDENLLYQMDYIPGHQSLGDDRYFSDEQRVAHPRGSFALLWDKIYPKQYNWQDNPECWVLDFERSEG